MEFGDVLRRRRMCRDFLDAPIDEAVLDTILAAATRAPAAGNTWGLDLLVLTGSQRDAYWDVALPPERRDGFAWPGLLRAPVLVVPVVDPGAYVARYAESDKAHTGLGAAPDDWPVPYWWVDGGAAVMAMLLAADDAGLGALLFGQFDHEPALATRFGIPDGRRAIGTVALGHPAPDGRRPSRSATRGRPPIERIVHRGHW